jgi:hypothetical protein
VLTSTESPSMGDRVLFVERSGEYMEQARLRSSGPQPKGNQVLIGRTVCFI